MEMETWWKRVRLPVLAVLGLLQYWYFWKCEVLVLVLILFLKISGIGIGIDILFEYGQYWYWYWYPFWKLSVLVFVLILTLKICRIDIDIDIVFLSYGMKYQYLLKRAGIAHLWTEWLSKAKTPLLSQKPITSPRDTTRIRSHRNIFLANNAWTRDSRVVIDIQSMGIDHILFHPRDSSLFWACRKQRVKSC